MEHSSIPCFKTENRRMFHDKTENRRMFHDKTGNRRMFHDKTENRKMFHDKTENRRMFPNCPKLNYNLFIVGEGTGVLT
jgi:hypothetical protein